MMNNQLLLMNYVSRGVLLTLKGDEPHAKKIKPIDDDLISDLKENKEQIRQALLQQKEEWLKLYKEEKNQAVRTMLKIIIEERFFGGKGFE